MSKSTVRKFGVGVASLALLASVAAPAMAAEDYNRLGGTDRYQTAAEMAKEVAASDVVYLTRGDVFADAIAAGKLTDGPILLVGEDAASQYVVKRAIADRKAKEVVVLGGTGAVSEDTVKAVAGTAKVTRVEGKDRFETAAGVSKRLTAGGKAAKVYLANGMNLADALAGGSVTDSTPILLVDNSGKLPKATADEIKRLGATEFVALGGTKAVSDAVLTEAALVNVDLKGVAADAVKKAKEGKVIAEKELTGWGSLDKDGMPVAASAPTTVTLPDDTAKTNGNGYPRAKYVDTANQTEVGGLVKAFTGWNAGITDAKKYADETGASLTKEVDSKKLPVFDKALADAKAAWEAKGKAIWSDSTSAATAETTAYMTQLGHKYASPITISATTTIADIETLAAKTSGYTTAYKEALDEYTPWAKYLKAAEEGKTAALKAISDADKIIAGNIGGALKIQRWGGSDRYETSVLIAKNGGRATVGGKIYLANGSSYADAVAGGMLNGAIVLVPSGEADLPILTQEYIKSVKAATTFAAKRQIVALGLSGAVSNKTLDAAIAIATK